MSGVDRKQPAPATDQPPDTQSPNSGEGAGTAYQAMLRKRKQAENSDPLLDPIPPQPPALHPQP